MKIIISMILCLFIAAGAVPMTYGAPEPLTAFPGAEGAAMYITGGRGGQVYEVTSLEDYKSNETPIPGTLRYGLYKVANINSDLKATTIVFRVSGTIHLKEKIKTNVYNLTIAGQSAPGDGITIGDYSVSLGGSNIIIRYLRFRGGFAELDDTFSPNAPKMMIDHCSFSWSTDEVLSTKDKSSITVQWSIISNALNMSIHDKGAHGYGGIWGGTNMTFHHNLIASNNSRNPRLDRDFRLEKDAPLLFDLRNNVFYNWGANSGYGGENATGVNIVNNYYKPGPATFNNVKNRIFNPSSEQPGNYYVDGNYMDGYPEISADNWAGGIQPDYGISSVQRLTNPVPITYKLKDNTVVDTSVHTDSTADVYEKVLNGAGTVLPKRDSLDARIVNDVRNGTGKFANTPDGDGGFPTLKEMVFPGDYDQDHDGIPSEWERENGLNPLDAADGNAVSGNGYTNLENYLNSIQSNGSNNPTVAITSPIHNAMLQSGQDIVIEAAASDSDGTIDKMEWFYYDTQAMKLNSLGTSTSAPYSFTWKNAREGTYYLYAKATDDSGTQTLSSMTIIHVNGTGDIAPWQATDIGVVQIPGTASASGSTITVKGSGEIGASEDGIHSSDAFTFVHEELKGDAEFISSLNFQNPSEYDNDVKAGLMLRQDLNTDSPFVMIAIMKEEYYGTRVHFMTRSAKGELMTSTVKPDIQLPALLKLTKYGDEIKGFISTDGGSYWENVGTTTLKLPETASIGLALDATKSTNNFDYYNTTAFENTSLLKVPKLSLNNPSSETVNTPEYTLSGHISAATSLIIKRNGELLTQPPLKYDAESDFQHSITLIEGANELEIVVSNTSGLTRTIPIRVFYDKSGEGNVFNISDVQLKGWEGQPVDTWSPLQDVQVSANLTSISDTAKDAVFVIMLQDASNQTISFSYTLESIQARKTQEVTATFKLPQAIADYKLSIVAWDDLQNAMPISNMVTLPSF
ncbi:Ig-like domain-containing protein [Paenibacillus sp. UNC451MF]|uniref:Ig-like domain-containing protein n=1 Tax=Paenibacillus sp. UNC451MF TaxID=1449063 RepID=UPI00069056EC|nr:Ig-like domain-containing protein [Paenibacillus sp. UNC451MF]